MTPIHRFLIGLVVLTMLIGAVLMQSARLSNAKDKLKSAQATITQLENERNQLRLTIEDNNRISEENSREFDNQISNLNSRLAATKRVLKDRCVPIYVSQGLTPLPAGKPDGAIGAGYVPGNVGLTADYLLTYGARCEGLRQKVIGLQKFVNDTWDAQR